MTRNVEVGKAAPLFTLQSESGSDVSLKSFRGKWVVLYFYPRDSTPVCTVQACSMRDMHTEFESVNAVVLGVSADSTQSHSRFSVRHSLTFPLLADANGEVSQRYGVWKLKSLFGHKYMGIERTTFVINPSGKIAAIFSKVKVRGHGAALLSAIQKASQAV